MADFAVDSFTGAADAPLASHVGEAGATWARQPGAGADPLPKLSGVGRLYPGDATGYGCYYASGTPATAEYDVTGVVYHVAAALTCEIGLAGRLATGAETGYVALLRFNTATWTLYRVVSGAFTQLGTPYVQALVDGATYAVTLRIRAAAKELFIAGVNGGAAVITSADDAITAAGKAGVYSQGYSAGLQLESFTASDAAAGAAKPVLFASHYRNMGWR